MASPWWHRGGGSRTTQPTLETSGARYGDTHEGGMAGSGNPTCPPRAEATGRTASRQSWNWQHRDCPGVPATLGAKSREFTLLQEQGNRTRDLVLPRGDTSPTQAEMPQLDTGARGISAGGCRQLSSHHGPGSLPASTCHPWERFFSSLQISSNQRGPETCIKPKPPKYPAKSQQNPWNPVAGASRKPQCTKSHHGAATARYRCWPGTSGIPSDTELDQQDTWCSHMGRAQHPSSPTGMNPVWLLQDIHRGEPSPCQHWCCPHHKPPDRIREAGQSFNYSGLPGAKQPN